MPWAFIRAFQVANEACDTYSHYSLPDGWVCLLEASRRLPYNSYVSLSAHLLIAEKDKTARGLSAALLRITEYPITELGLFG